MFREVHVENRAADYALGLLSRGERRRVEDHLMACAACRQAIKQESKLALAVRATLDSVSRPEGRRLRQLMPPPPKRQRGLRTLALQEQFAPVVLLVILLLGSWGLWRMDQQQIWVNPSPTFLSATATMTDVPTATLAQTATAEDGVKARAIVVTAPARPLVVTTPVPKPAVIPIGQPPLVGD